ncbi:hypothetical protein SLEP1_g46644 [Rubroshorea leprosula]|uniref:SURP motif domain-containing protein n=1 Tax=Rubroshorea leprosula TaxID=152421 RepID=A0AAV5LMW8_9ROSI|nr:hypothetical protein SLEP1_g46644 [Rubroshorea leprosula]
MPDHPLHPYYRFLVDHQELLSGKSQEEGIKFETSSVGGGGALSLLGTTYGFGEDEEGAGVNSPEHERNTSVEAGSVNKTLQSEAEQKEPSLILDGKDQAVPKYSPPLKGKASVLKRNPSMWTSEMRKENDGNTADKSRASALPVTSEVELPVVEPPSDLKRVVDKIVHFIMKNGKEFESVLAEQDVRHGRSPFLMPANQYHPYYRKVLQKAEESKLSGQGIISERHDPSSLGAEKASRESDAVSVGSDIPYDSDRKEKFKMVLGKSKKDGQYPSPKVAKPEIGVTVDVAAAAAILQAARRGVKNPHVEVLLKTSLNGSSQAPSSEGGSAWRSGSQLLSQPFKKGGDLNVSTPIANAIAKTAAVAAASEVDSSEASLSKEQKLKAERLKRAKMFAAMIKSGAAPLKTDPSCGFSVEPPESGLCGSGNDGINLSGKEREGSSVLLDVITSDRTEKYDKKYSGDEHSERRPMKSYYSRSEKLEDDEEDVQEEEKDEKGRDCMNSRRERRSHHLLDHGRNGYKQSKRHSSSKDRDSRRRYKHNGSSDEEHMHKHSSSDNEYRHSHHHCKHDKSSDNEHQHSQYHHKHNSSSGNEGRLRMKRSHSERETELEAGEICAKLDQSKPSDTNGEASVDDVSTSYPDRRAPSLPSEGTTVSDDLRAKIRAMLMATF